MPEVVPELLVREHLQVVVVVAVKHMVEALHITRAHHGHQGRLEDIRLLYELVLEDVGGLGLLYADTSAAVLSTWAGLAAQYSPDVISSTTPKHLPQQQAKSQSKLWLCIAKSCPQH